MFNRPKIEFAEAGSDPFIDPPAAEEKPKLSMYLMVVGVIAAIIAAGGTLLNALAAPEPPIAPTLIATIYSATTTPAPLATWTPYPTLTPYPTYTLYPETPTPAPTSTLYPTLPPATLPPARVEQYQGDPMVLATWTPGPWMATKFAKGKK